MRSNGKVRGGHFTPRAHRHPGESRDPSLRLRLPEPLCAVHHGIVDPRLPAAPRAAEWQAALEKLVVLTEIGTREPLGRQFRRVVRSAERLRDAPLFAVVGFLMGLICRPTLNSPAGPLRWLYAFTQIEHCCGYRY